MSRYTLLILLTLIIVACADSHQLVRSNPTSSNQKFGSSDSFFISVPQNGIYGEKIYQSSGVMTTQILMSSFAKRVREVKTGRSYQSFEDSLLAAKEANSKYLIYPTILEWEDRATEWSGIPDRVSIKVEIINVANGQTVESAIVKGKSGLATLGGDHPQDLLPKPIDEFVGTFF